MSERRARRAAFILTASNYGPMIVNRLDINPETGNTGVGANILEFGHHLPDEIGIIEGFFEEIEKVRKPPFLFLDGGANVGDHTVPIGKFLEGRGAVLAFECQHAVFMALCGNIALNNLTGNCIPVFAALDRTPGRIISQQWSPDRPANFGGARPTGTPGIGRPPDWAQTIDAVTVDGVMLGRRLDVLKLDIENMEPAALIGAAKTIARDRPIVYAEHHYCGYDKIEAAVDGYDWERDGMMMIGRPQKGIKL